MRVKYMSMYTIKLKIEHTHIVEHHRAAVKKTTTGEEEQKEMKWKKKIKTWNERKKSGSERMRDSEK